MTDQQRAASIATDPTTALRAGLLDAAQMLGELEWLTPISVTGYDAGPHFPTVKVHLGPDDLSRLCGALEIDPVQVARPGSTAYPFQAEILIGENLLFYALYATEVAA